MFCGVALASFGSWYFGGNTGQGLHSSQPSFVLPSSLKKFSWNVKISQAIPLYLSRSAATSEPMFCGVSRASVGSWYFGRIMWFGLHSLQRGHSFSFGRANISASRYMSQIKSIPRPNLSFNPDPTVRDNYHDLNIRLTVGPVNFVR